MGFSEWLAELSVLGRTFTSTEECWKEYIEIEEALNLNPPPPTPGRREDDTEPPENAFHTIYIESCFQTLKAKTRYSINS